MIKQIVKSQIDLEELIANEFENIEHDMDDDEVVETIFSFMSKNSPKSYPVFALIEFIITKYNVGLTYEYFTKDEIDNLKWE